MTNVNVRVKLHFDYSKDTRCRCNTVTKFTLVISNCVLYCLCLTPIADQTGAWPKSYELKFWQFPMARTGTICIVVVQLLHTYQFFKGASIHSLNFKIRTTIRLGWLGGLLPDEYLDITEFSLCLFIFRGWLGGSVEI